MFPQLLETCFTKPCHTETGLLQLFTETCIKLQSTNSHQLELQVESCSSRNLCLESRIWTHHRSDRSRSNLTSQDLALLVSQAQHLRTFAPTLEEFKRRICQLKKLFKKKKIC